jgi:glycosyltransferase involved in cell wall biosynthesis
VNKRVLIVTSCYPPVAAMGSARMLSFVRHLPSYGWDPAVITAAPGWRDVDASVAIPDDDRICWTRAIDVGAALARVMGRAVRGHAVARSAAAAARRGSPMRLALRLYDEVLAFPDSMWPWYHLGKSLALAFARARRPDIILSSSPHPTAHRLAAYLERHLHTPWVAEFRDPWSQTPWFESSEWLRRRTLALELELIRPARALCAASSNVADLIARLHGKKAFVVLNGFEPSDHLAAPPPFDVFTIVYTGMIYPGKRDPRMVFDALRRLADRGAVRPDSVQMIFCGPNHDITHRMAREAGVEDYVRCLGMLPRVEALAMQRRASLLLQLEWVNDLAKGVYSGKFFEYLGAGRPIFAVGPKGSVVEETLQRTGRGAMASTVDEIEAALERAIEQGPAVAPVESHAMEMAEYTRAHQAGVLARHLDELTSSS